MRGRPSAQTEDVPLVMQIQQLRHHQELLQQTHQRQEIQGKKHAIEPKAARQAKSANRSSPESVHRDKGNQRRASASRVRKSSITLTTNHDQQPIHQRQNLPGRRRPQQLPAVNATVRPQSAQSDPQARKPHITEKERKKRDFVAALWARSSGEPYQNGRSPGEVSINDQIDECESLFSEGEEPTKTLLNTLPDAFFSDYPNKVRNENQNEPTSAHSREHRTRRHSQPDMIIRPRSAVSERSAKTDHHNSSRQARQYPLGQDRFSSQVNEINVILANRGARSSLNKMLHTQTGSLPLELARRKELDSLEQELSDQAVLLEKRKRELEEELLQVQEARKSILKEAARQQISIGRLFKIRLRDFYRMIRSNELQFSRVAYREAAAITIQTAWRGSLASNYVNVLRRAQGLPQHVRYPNVKPTQTTSVHDIQDMLALLSGPQFSSIPTAVRNELQIAMEKHLTEKAAVSLQKAFRGHQVRHKVVPNTKNYRSEWEDFWSDGGKSPQSQNPNNERGSLGSLYVFPEDNIQHGFASGGERTQYNQYVSNNDDYFATSLDANTGAGLQNYELDDAKSNRYSLDVGSGQDYEDQYYIDSPYAPIPAGTTGSGVFFPPDWSENTANFAQDEALPPSTEENYASTSYGYEQSIVQMDSTSSQMQPGQGMETTTEAVEVAADALRQSGYVCLTDLDDLTAFQAGVKLQMIRSNGAFMEVTLLEFVQGMTRVRCKCSSDGRVVIKKLRYFYTVPTDLLELAHEEESQETVENVKALVGDWEICHDEDGTEFYYNRLTGKSVWEKPKEVQLAQAKGQLGSSSKDEDEEGSDEDEDEDEDDSNDSGNEEDSDASDDRKKGPSYSYGSRSNRAGSVASSRRNQRKKRNSTSYDMDELSGFTGKPSSSRFKSSSTASRFNVFF